MTAMPPIDRDRVVRAFFFIAFAWLTYQLFLLAKPFMPGLLGALMLAMAFAPLYAWVKRRLKNPNLAASILTLGVLVMVVFPLVIVGEVFIREAGKLLPTVQIVLEEAQNHNLDFFRGYVPPVLQTLFFEVADLLGALNIDLREILLENASKIGARFTASSFFLARHALFSLFNGMVMMGTLFFAFRDGEKFLHWFLSAVPLRSDHKEVLARRVYDTFRGVTIGVFATAAAQGLAATIGFWIAGLRLPLLLGMATSMASLLGASIIVTLPAALWMMAHDTYWGMFLMIWALAVVGLLDNFLKPILIGSRARMPFVLTFFSILGGIKLYGLIGIILGPIVVASFLTFVKIFREEYRHG